MENKEKQIPVSEGTKIILNIVQSELLPTVDKMRKLLIDVQNCRIKFHLYSPELNNLQKEYNNISVIFFNIARKLETPDILFKDLKPDPQDIVGYFQFQVAISKHLNDGSNYIEILDRTLDRKNESIQNARTLILAIMAILISIFNR